MEQQDLISRPNGMESSEICELNGTDQDSSHMMNTIAKEKYHTVSA